MNTKKRYRISPVPFSKKFSRNVLDIKIFCVIVDSDMKNVKCSESVSSNLFSVREEGSPAVSPSRFRQNCEFPTGAAFLNME